MDKKVPIDTRGLFEPLDQKLIELLKALEPEEWNNQTVAKAWKVKDVASHLLDGNLRTLSMQRDAYFGDSPPKEVQEYSQLVRWLNELNADWVKATRRLSPDVLIALLEFSGNPVSKYYAGLKPWETAIFPVAWAGESTSYNWMHVAREYTEKWHHQQQIREAVGVEGILTHEFFYPVMDTFFMALPYTFKDIDAPMGTTIKVMVSSGAGGEWYLEKLRDHWELVKDSLKQPVAEVEIPIDISWQLFSKSLRPSEVQDKIRTLGDKHLGEQVLEMVAVMA